MNAVRGKLVSGGRLQVPADFRHRLSLQDGDTVLMEVIDGELHTARFAMSSRAFSGDCAPMPPTA